MPQTDGQKQLTLTPDHQVFTPRGWLPVNTLNPGFEVGTIRNGKLKWVAVESISPQERQKSMTWISQNSVIL